MEKIFLRANFSSDTKFRRRVYLFFSLSLYFEGEGKKCFQERFSIPQTSPRFSNFLPLVFPSISTSPPPLLANPFPFLPVLQYRAVYRATRSFYDAIYSRKWSSDGVTPRNGSDSFRIRSFSRKPAVKSGTRALGRVEFPPRVA